MSQQQPYIGPKPFGLEERTLFFGRDREESDLLALTCAHPVVVLYAQSGAGKTSLLEAKLVPELYALKAEVFRGVRVGGDLPPGINASDVTNLFVFNAVMTLRDTTGSATQLVKTTLPEAFRLEHKVLKDEDEPLRVVIFDQFEEIFTSHADRWKDRSGFFDQVAQALKADPFLHVVFAIREEYLGSMMPYANELPGRLRIGLRLERLRRKAALEAVINPVRTTDRTFAPEAADSLVDNLILNAEYIEPLHLQVVCRNLWQSLDPATKVITTDSIQTYGDLDTALRGYYEECVSRTAAAKGIAEIKLRTWFADELILPGNKRNLVHQEQETTAGLPNEIVKLLDEQHLIRPELRGGTLWYEIAHDRFVRPIVDSNAAWWQVNDAIGLSLQEQAQTWEAAGRAKPFLLSGVTFHEARRWREGPGAEIWRAGGFIREFIEASESQEKRRRARANLIRLLILAGAVCLFLAILVMQAKKAEKAAKTAQRTADSLRKKAEETKLVERGLFASSLVESQVKRPRQFDALVWGIKAMGPSLAKNEIPPLEATKGLQDALRPLGSTTLFLTSPKATPQFSFDNLHLLTYSNGQVDLIDAATGRVRWHKELAKEVEYFNIEISPNSSQILASATFKQPKAGVNPAQEDPEAKRAKRKVWLLAATTGQPIEAASLADLTGGFFGLDASHLVGIKGLGDKRYLIRLLDAKDLRVIREIDSTGLEHAAISPDGETLAMLTENATVELWSSGNNDPPRIIKLMETENTSMLGVMFSPDSQRLLITNIFGDQRAIILNTATGQQVLSKEILPDESVYFTPDSKLIIASSLLRVLLIDAITGETSGVRDLGDVETIFFSEDKTRALCIRGRESELASLTVLDLASGKVSEMPSQPLGNDEIAASPLLDLVATVDAEGIGRIFTLSKPPADLLKVPDRELLEIACRQLRVRIESGEVADEEVKTICAENK